MADTSNILVISGANGTGTSLVLAMLNARPDIFVMYEVRPHRAEPGPYTRSFLERFPELEQIIADRSLAPLARYGRIQAALREKGQRYRYFGDKVPTLDAAEVAKLTKAPFFIFTVRDIRTWLCKEKIFRLPHVAGNVVPIVRQYLAMFFSALAAEHALILRMEECVLDGQRVVDKLGEYLRLPDNGQMAEWWKHVIPAEQDPKAACPWFGSGRIPGKAAGLRPVELDVECELRDHRLWDIVLPVFDKYCGGLEQRRFSAAEIASDRTRLDAALAGLEAPLAELFSSFTSWKYALDEAGRPTRRNVWRLSEDGRLYRPGRFREAGVKEARELMREAKRSVLLMIEEEVDEPVTAVRHWNLFDSRRFRDAVEKAGVLVLRMAHEDARALVPELRRQLQAPRGCYLYRQGGSTEWRPVPEGMSVDSLTSELVAPPRQIIERAKAKALAKAREGIAELEELGFDYELVERGPRKKRPWIFRIHR